VMGVEATKSFGKSRQLKRERESIKDLEYTAPNTTANYNIQLSNEAPQQGGVDTAALTTEGEGGTILNPEADKTAVGLDDNTQFNPNPTNELPQGPSEERLAAGGAQGPQAGGGGGGGGLGGTSAAQEDGGPQAPAKTKDQVGSYASSDGAGGPRGAGGKAAGGAGGVGIDQSFADLLKKLLPGEDEGEKKDAGAEQVALGDRAPASDQAAVIGRNQNIFEVIHKRYLKKNQEGAVLYNL
jgi:hypothetical protein